MKRRDFFMAAAVAGSSGMLLADAPAKAAPVVGGGLPKAKVTRIRYYRSPTDAAGRPAVHTSTINQSTNVVVVETDQGLVGIGEGGSADIMEQCATQLIGKDPFRTERLWQTMFRGYFYPAGREKTHAIGALDVALWDLKAKALGLPLYQLLGGKSRDHVECYATGFAIPGQPNASHGERARACVEAGFRAYRLHDPGLGRTFDRFEQVPRIAAICKEIRDAVGKDGAWAIDYHGEFDLTDAVKLSEAIQHLGPYFCEDLLRSEDVEGYKTLRKMVKVPIALGEVFSDKWQWTTAIENDLIDYARLTVPNVGGVTEFMKIAAMCEAHFIGLIPHFTGPISEATLVHCVASTSGPALMEMAGGGRREWPYLKQGYDFKDGKLWINDRPGHGVEVDTSKLQLIGDYKEAYTAIPTLDRPDGSYTNW
ncbi:mandelate racemase/muconate lactonizing enzyme family protein [Glacieibacterium sp.]|uniref:mandelate racemase/muconate lactonizing enzyme family protein n=1 Tax=Glacieibacterium sp. TaxID=2860237 RepID=UPI003B0017D9